MQPADRNSYAPTIVGERFIVVDNLLSSGAFLEARQSFEKISMAPTTSAIDGEADGLRFHGGTAVLELAKECHFPSAMNRKVIDVVKSTPSILDGALVTATAMSFTAWIYPCGSGLSWHADSGTDRLGAFVYYMHSCWELDQRRTTSYY